MQTCLTPLFCRFCGTTLIADPSIGPATPGLYCRSPDCVNRGKPDWAGPAILVQTFIFAQSRLLLLKRGIPPYVGRWAPPGGFVEAFESPESAAIRETLEEVGVHLDVESLIPLGIVSVSSINQVYFSFLVRLDGIVALRACAPEALDARWFPEQAFPLSDIWEPFAEFDMSILFDRMRAGRFEFYQRTDDFVRVFSERERITYLRRSVSLPVSR
jgi:ADP-ribose pyrophosphatase YjhB (NUDIX family)